jgi:hypothetical protein
MYNLECPNCGRLGTVPNEKANSRLVCKKCHTIFHLSPTGRVLLGEPPTERKPEPQTETRLPWADDTEYSFSLPDLHVTPTQIGLGVLLVGVVWLFYFLSTLNLAEDLNKKADRAVAAMLTGDVETLKQFSTDESAEITGQWYDSVRNYFDDVRGLPSGARPMITIMVSEENSKAGIGQTLVYVAAPKANSRRSAGKAPDPSDYYAPNQLTFNWVLDKRWRWRLEGASLPAVPVISGN